MKKHLILAAVLGAAPLVSAGAPAPARTETAVLAGGCFWGMEGVYDHVKGVRSAVSGYAGGSAQTANYEDVSTERTGHAEAVRISYDPGQISYTDLLRIYFIVAHDPTQLNRQDPDSGPSYRSAIFPQNVQQRKIAQAVIARLGASGVYKWPIVTRIETGAFYPAEGYHQHFLLRNPDYPYIVANDAPKVAALKRLFPKYYR